MTWGFFNNIDSHHPIQALQNQNLWVKPMILMIKEAEELLPYRTVNNFLDQYRLAKAQGNIHMKNG